MTSSGLNYGGVALALATLFLLVMVSPEASAGPSGTDGPPLESLSDPLLLDLAGDRTAPFAADEESSQWARQRAGGPKPDPVLLVASLNANDAGSKAAEAPSPPHVPKLWDRLSPPQRRVFGCVLALVAGALSGSTFTAPQ